MNRSGTLVTHISLLSLVFVVRRGSDETELDSESVSELESVGSFDVKQQPKGVESLGQLASGQPTI